MRDVGVGDCEHEPPPRGPRRTAIQARANAALVVLACACAAVVVLALVTTAHGHGAAHSTIGAMTRSAAHVFRGRCTAVAVETMEIGGTPLAVTAYTFHVREHLKGSGSSTFTFRQVGTPDGGARDLGHLVGLPVYAPGTEYVLFLLPDSRAGVTSPAGAAEGAYLVRDGSVARVRGAAPSPTRLARSRVALRPPVAEEPASYDELRRAVLDELAQ